MRTQNDMMEQIVSLKEDNAALEAENARLMKICDDLADEPNRTDLEKELAEAREAYRRDVGAERGDTASVLALRLVETEDRIAELEAELAEAGRREGQAIEAKDKLWDEANKIRQQRDEARETVEAEKRRSVCFYDKYAECATECVSLRRERDEARRAAEIWRNIHKQATGDKKTFPWEDD